MQELLGKYKFEDVSKEIQDNLVVLLAQVNIIRGQWGKPMTVTSGLRTMADHLKIYAAKGVTDPSKIPMHSRHLIGAAVDIYDPGLLITAWLKNDTTILENAKLFCELGNADWVHFQCIPYGSWTEGKSHWFCP
jgi:uncharacterized protein YcbK (DUF882 family)